MSEYKKIEMELAKQMSAHHLLFNVESVEDAADEMDHAVDHIADAYQEMNSVGEMVAAYIEDTKIHNPEYFRAAETIAS